MGRSRCACGRREDGSLGQHASERDQLLRIRIAARRVDETGRESQAPWPRPRAAGPAWRRGARIRATVASPSTHCRIAPWGTSRPRRARLRRATRARYSPTDDQSTPPEIASRPESFCFQAARPSGRTGATEMPSGRRLQGDALPHLHGQPRIGEDFTSEWLWVSMNPGRRLARAVMTSGALSAEPTAAIRAPRRPTSATRAGAPVPSRDGRLQHAIERHGSRRSVACFPAGEGRRAAIRGARSGQRAGKSCRSCRR